MQLLDSLVFLFPLSMSAFVCVSFSSSSSSGTAPTRGSPGLQNQTSSTGRPGFHGDSTTGAPGLHTTRSQGGIPGVASPGVTGQPGLQKTTTSGTGIVGCWSNLLFTHCCWVFIRKFNSFFLAFFGCVCLQCTFDQFCFCPKPDRWTTKPSVYQGVTTGQPGLHLTTTLHSGRPGLQTTKCERHNGLAGYPPTRQDPWIKTLLQPLFFYLIYSPLDRYNPPWRWPTQSALCGGPVCMPVIWLCPLCAGVWRQTGLFGRVRWRTLWYASPTCLVAD